MKYKNFKDNIELSRLGMGNMRLPVINNDEGNIDYEKAKAIIDKAMQDGINYYDTAYIYHNGQSERFLGEALSEYPRDSFYVADKYNMMANPDYRVQFAEQQERLQMDRIDFYLIHGVQDAFIDSIVQSGCIQYFDSLKAEKKISYLGFSFHGTPDGLRRTLPLYAWDFVQIQLNYYDWYFGDAKELYEILTEAGIPVMVMEPVHGGLLANMTEKAESLFKSAEAEKSVASWAMRWVMALENVQVVLSGMSDIMQAEDNVKTFEEALPLTQENEEMIKKAASLQYADVAVACTACHYCCPDCPQKIDIPMLLKAYNDAKIGGAWRLSSLMSVPQDKWPSACIGCGSCTRHCPQSFDIPTYMKEMEDMMKAFS